MDAASLARYVPRLRSLLESRDALVAHGMRLEAERDALAAHSLRIEAERDALAARAILLEAENRVLTENIAPLQETVDRYGLWPPGHFYSPHPDLDAVERDRIRLFGDRVKPLAGVDLGIDRQLELLDRLAPFSRDQPFSFEPDGRHRYYYDNIWFGPGDAIVYHCMLRHLRPSRVIEVGIGFSSAMLLDTNDEFLDNGCTATFIDPHPGRMLELLGSTDGHVNIIAEPVQNVGQKVFSSLEAGDILFIDSSHVTKAGSDVNYLYFDVIPSLPSGVFVHVHDIFWPFEYPQAWVMEGRAWNEAYLLRAYLTANHDIEIIWFNNYLAQRYRDRISAALSVWADNPGGSLWLRVK